MITLSLTYPITDREELARKLSLTVEGDIFPFYMPNGENDYWKLDSGNDWGLRFETNEQHFTLMYRYASYPGTGAAKELALANWLVARWGCEIVSTEQPAPQAFPPKVVLP